MRQSAISMAEDISRNKIKQAELLTKLSQWMKDNPPPKEVEELIWSMLCSHSGGNYI